MKGRIGITFSSWMWVVSGLFLLPCMALAQTVYINEVMSSNVSTIMDEDGEPSDWVELYNPGPAAVNLDQWGLTDNASNPYKWRFGDVSIQPGEFMMVWASNKDRPAVTNGNAIHTSWAISSGGEDIVLTRPDGTTVDFFGALIIGVDRSAGRKPDGTGPVHLFDAPTPGAANTTVGIPLDLEPPQFSIAGGVYTSSVSLSLSTTVDGGVIRYTLDGSEPTSSSPVYSGPITINQRAPTANLSNIPTNNDPNPGPPYYEGWQAPEGEVFRFRTVRAKVFKTGSQPSRTITQSYVIHPAGANRYSLPIVSINTDAANFFDPNIGIYVPGNHGNMFQSGSEWERPGSLEFYETDGTLGFSGNIGIRLHGSSTRSRPRKSLRIYARSPGSFNYQIFPDKPINRFETFILRSGGNDWGNAIFRDAYAQSLVAHTDLDRQYYRPVVMFLNGEYWGIHNIRDRFDDGYHFSHYGLGPNDFVQLESDLAISQQPIYDRGYEPLVGDYANLLNFVNIQRVVSSNNYAILKDRMDVDNFIDYFTIETFSGNSDWPGNNMRLWRSVATNRAPDAPYRHDGRWRWMLFDTDFGFGANFNYVPGRSQFADYNMLAHAASVNGEHFSNKTNATLLFRRLLENTEFRQSFVTRYSDHLNSSFKTERLLAQLNSMQQHIAPEMAEHSRRWRQPVNWSNDVQRIRDYATQRPTAVWGHLQSFFNLGGRRNIIVDVSDVNEGYVRVNTMDVTPDLPGVSASVYPWTGSYFTNTTISLTAKAKPGYKFVKWVNGVTGADITTNLTYSFTHASERTYTALFEQDQSGLNPQPFSLNVGDFMFNEWAATEPAGTYPAHMIFEQVDSADPGLNVEMDSYWVLAYNISSRSRINGLGANGMSFINTGDKVAQPGSGFVGSAIVALSTIGSTNVKVLFTAGTVTPNFRTYALRLQYRIGGTGPFIDVLENGQPVEYVRNATAGHTQNFGPVSLPSAMDNKPYVQLRWKYYYIDTGVSGARAQIRLDDIIVTGDKAPTPPVVKVSANTNFGPSGGTAWLNGSLSKDLDGEIVSYNWSQISGPTVTMIDSTQAIARATIPARSQSTTYQFRLVVTDDDGLSSTGVVTVSQAVNYSKTYDQVYFRGTANGWGTTSMSLVSNYIWEVQTTFGSSADERFKFDINGDWSLNFGDNNNDGIADQGGANIAITQGAGLYTIRFNDQTKHYWIIKYVPPQPPVANAGPNQNVSPSGGNVSLNGSGSTDPDGMIVSYAWSQLSGPSATINNAGSAITTVTIPAGSNGTVYVFRLVVTDSDGLSATGSVSVTQQLLKSYNQVYFRGTANAWGNRLMTLVSNYVWETEVVFGNASDERFKFDINGDWTLNFGDNNNDGIADQSGANIMITQGAGTYIIRFNDQTRQYWRIKQIVNVPPVANAGANQTISLAGGNRTLNGSGSTDSDGTIVAYAWSQVSGPSAIISNANVAITTINIPAQSGSAVYVFALVVTDNSGASSTGTVSITQQNIAPVANAGTNQTILLVGGELTLDGSGSSDADGSIVSYSWSQVSGPEATITNGSTAVVTVVIPEQIAATSYVFALVVTDNDGASSTGTVTITQAEPVLLKTYEQMYFRGTPNGWGTTIMTLVSNYVWEVQASFGSTTNERFKFDVNGDWSLNFGDNNNDGIADQSGANIMITQGVGTYTIRFNDQTRQYWRIKQIVNQPPVVNAGTNQTIGLSGGTVTLNGSGSYDVEGSIVSYAWSQVSGPAAIISNPAGAIASVAIPARTSLTTYVFALVATDNEGLSATGTVTITQQSAALLKTYNQVFFRGTPNGWGTTAMTLVSNYVWEVEAVFGPGSNERFKFDVFGDWSLNFGDNNADFIADQSGANIMIQQGSGTYTIRFNDQTRRYWVFKNGVGFMSAYNSMTVAGSFNSWNPAANNMVLVDHYTWQYDVVLFSAIQFKFAANGAWASGNWGDLNPSGTTLPLNGIAEASAANIVVSTPLSGAYRIIFNEQTRAYSMNMIPAMMSFGDASAMYTTPWEKLYQINLLDPVQREIDPDADGLKNLTEYYQDTNPYSSDTDGDGVSDREELLAGTDPRVAGDFLSAELELDGNQFVIKWQGAGNRTYAVEYTGSLSGSDWVALNGYTALNGFAGVMSADVTGAIEAGAIGFRIRIVHVDYLPE